MFRLMHVWSFVTCRWMMVRVRGIRNGRCPLEVIDSEAEAETEDDTMEGFEDAEEGPAGGADAES